MGKIANTRLVSNNSLPKLNRIQYNGVIDYLSKCTSSTRYSQPNLIDYVDEKLYEKIILGLDEVCSSDDFKALDKLYVSKSNKKYVYQVEFVRSSSGLASARSILKKLLLTNSEIKNLSGRRTRRGDEYCYTLLVDCSDASYPSQGIHRLARLVCAFNERKTLIDGMNNEQK